MGNINKISLKKAIESQKLADFKVANKVPQECQSCDYFAKCTRCPATVEFVTGSITKILEENCRMAKLRYII